MSIRLASSVRFCRMTHGSIRTPTFRRKSGPIAWMSSVKHTIIRRSDGSIKEKTTWNADPPAQVIVTVVTRTTYDGYDSTRFTAPHTPAVQPRLIAPEAQTLLIETAIKAIVWSVNEFKTNPAFHDSIRSAWTSITSVSQRAWKAIAAPTSSSSSTSAILQLETRDVQVLRLLHPAKTITPHTVATWRDILGFAETDQVSSSALKAHYHALLKVWHPDQTVHDVTGQKASHPHATDVILLIQRAYTQGIAWCADKN